MSVQNSMNPASMAVHPIRTWLVSFLISPIQLYGAAFVEPVVVHREEFDSEYGKVVAEADSEFIHTSVM